jgi:hypothetical protein
VVLIMEMINNQPRKYFGFKTPNQLFLALKTLLREQARSTDVLYCRIKPHS